MTTRILRNILLAAAALATAACSRPGSDVPFEWRDRIAPGAVVHVRNGVGNISVSRSSDSSMLVRGTRRWHRRPDVNFTVVQRGNDYYVCAMWRFSGRCDGSYKGRNNSGLLSMFSLFHRSSDAVAGFTIELPAGVQLDARTTSGSVEINGTTGGVTARTMNGTVRATNVSGSLVLTSTNGDLRVSADSLAMSDSLRLNTTNGSVHAELPKGLEALYDLSVMNGNVASDIPLAPENGRNQRHLSGRIGSAPRNVRMRAVNGQVIVTTR